MFQLIKDTVAGNAAGFIIRQLQRHLFWRYSRPMRYYDVPMQPTGTESKFYQLDRSQTVIDLVLMGRI